MTNQSEKAKEKKKKQAILIVGQYPSESFQLWAVLDSSDLLSNFQQPLYPFQSNLQY